MVSSVTQICNLALAHLGRDRLENVSSDDGETARWCNELYVPAREFVTADALWRHAKKIAVLAEADNDREDDWIYAYQRPSDCLRFWYMLPETGRFWRPDAIPYETFADIIYSDELAARGLYIRSVEDTAKFTPSFVNALSWYLAHLLASPLKMSEETMANMLQGYASAKANAIATDSAEQLYVPTADEVAADWIAYR